MQEELPLRNSIDELAFTPSVSIGEIFARARTLERNGHDVIHFDAGEPDFGPPAEVLNATYAALKSGKNRYTEPGGIIEVRKAIAEHLNHRYHINLTSKQILITVGGRMALYLAFRWLPRNSTIGLICPYYPAFKEMTHYMSYQSQMFTSTLEESWTPNIDEISKHKFSAVILNSPCNPTGKILGPSILDSIVNIAREKDAMILSDEVYADYVFDEGKTPFKSILEVKDCKYLLISSFSKSYAMTGFRTGYVVGDERTISDLEKINRMILLSPPEFTQYAIIAAIQCKEYIRDKVILIKKRRDIAAKILSEYLDAEFYVPDGSLYIFPKLERDEGTFDSEKFALELLENQHVSITPGTVFGSWYRNFIRLTLLQNEDRITEGIERMAKQLRK